MGPDHQGPVLCIMSQPFQAQQAFLGSQHAGKYFFLNAAGRGILVRDDSFPSLPSHPGQSSPSPILSPPAPPQCFPSNPWPLERGMLIMFKNSLPLPYLSSSLDLQVANGLGELFSPLTWIACPSMTEWGESGKGELTYIWKQHIWWLCEFPKKKKIFRLRRINQG